MRITELFETKINNDKYIPALNKLLSSRTPLKIGAQGEKGVLIPNAGQTVKSMTDQISGTVDGKPTSTSVASLYKSPELKAAFTNTPLDQASSKIRNRGNTAEGILGAATLARLIKRPGSDITIDDLIAVIDKFPPANNNTGGSIVFTAKEVDNPIVDKFTLTVKLPVESYEDFKDVNKMLSDKKNGRSY